MKHGAKCAVTVCNGGDISIDEALLAWLAGIPVIVLQGTERAADTIVEAFNAGKLSTLFDQSFDSEGRELREDTDNRDTVSRIDFAALCKWTIENATPLLVLCFELLI